MSASRVATALWIALASVCVTARAVEPNAGPPSPPRFRRVFIPSDEIKNRPWKGAYPPIDAKEFQQLLETIEASAAGAPGPRAAQIEKAEYTLELVGEDLLVGSGTLQLVRRSEAGGILVLDPCTPAVHEAVWQDQKAKPAVLGTGPDGRLRVLVEGSSLSCAWSLRGERTASGAVNFRLELPGSPIQRLTLDAAGGLDVSADQGIVSKTAGAAGTNRWTIDLGGHNRFDLKVVAEAAIRERRPLTLSRQSLDYQFSSRGINVIAQLTVDVHGEPLERIAVNLDPGLRLVGARYGELDVPWSSTDDVETRVSHVLLQLPDPIVGTGRVLRLSAVAPMTSGKHWRLPGLAAEGMSWQEGTATLMIPESFVLEQLTTEGCRQSRTTVLPAPSLGESIEIQYYRPGATIEVFVAERREPLSIDSGTLLEVNSNDVSSRSAVQFSLAHGERHAVEIEVNPGWTIDAVEDLESNHAVDWEGDELPAEGARMKIRLPTAISADNPARLLLRGHRRLPTGPVFDGRQLEMLSFDRFAGGTRLISVRAAEGSELRWTDSEDLNTRDVLELSASEMQLFPTPPSGWLFVEDKVFSQSTVGIERHKPSYTAHIRIDAAVQKDVLTETYTIQCVPQAARVERLLVHFSQARDVPLEWSLAGGTSGQFSARKISAGQQAQAGMPSGGEVWELVLHLVRPGAFELRAIRSAAFRAETPLSLASVVDASAQRGTLAIRAIGESALSINNRRLTSAPAELLEADRYQTARATYHYQPARDDLGSDAAVSIAPARSNQVESGAWVWSNRLDSRYAVDGTCIHWATFRIQTAGRQQVRCSLPRDAKLQAAWVDRQRLPLTPEASQHDGFLVELPSGRSFATLSLSYATAGHLPAVIASERPPFPKLDIPIMTRQWSVWLPPGYQIVDGDERFGINTVAAPTWTERLFGVLGRGARTAIFNPLAAADWREMFVGHADVTAARSACEQFAADVGTQVADQLNAEELTWGQLLALAGNVETKSGRALLVDPEGLAELGLIPQTRVGIPSAHSDLDRGLALLRQANVVLLAHRGIILITNRSTAASYARQLAEPDAGFMYAILPGLLADELRGTTEHGQWSQFRSIDSWLATSQQSLWAPSAAIPLNVNQGRGWSMYTLQLSDASTPSIRIVRTAAMRSLGWAVFLALSAAGLWIVRRQTVLLVVLVTVGVSGSLLLPAAYLPLTSSAFMAGLFCFAVRMMRLSQSRPPGIDLSHGSQQRRLMAAHPVALLLVASAIVNVGRALNASQPDATRPPPLPAGGLNSAAPKAQAPSDANPHPPSNEAPPVPVYRVFVPVDAQQNPVGGKYYVPEQLYSQLYRQAAAASGQPKGWLITRAVYKGTLSRDPVSKRLELSHLKASFDLQVFQSNVDVRLPFAKEGSGGVVIGARLEGRSIPLNWNTDGTQIVVGPLVAERYRLELDVEPSAQSDAVPAGFDLAIPALANAMLELTFPPDTQGIEIPGARGKITITVEKDRGKLQARLGACDRLSVRWPRTSGTDAAAPNLEVEELIWVKVRPGTTMVDAKFKYRVLSGRVDHIRLLTDPRLRLLPATSTSPIAAVHTVPGNPQKIDLELSRALTDETVLELSFLVTGASGVGNLRLPRLESNGARAAKRWLAVSVDPALQFTVQAGEDSKQLDLPEFNADWGVADAKPLAVYAIPRGEPMWVLATQPNEPGTDVEQTLAVSLGRNSARVQFDAVLNISGGYSFQLRLQVPPAMTIEQISVLEDDVQRVARWSTDRSGRVTVFLTAPVNGRRLLSMRGRLEVATSEAFAVPQFQVLSAETRKRRLQLYRQPAVLAEIETGAGVSEIDRTEFVRPEGFGAWLGGYSIEDPKATVTLKLTPNVPRWRAIIATYLERDAQRWIAEVEYHADVTEGLVDALEFEIPAQWSEPYSIEPPAPFKIVPIPGELRRQMIVYPDKPIAGKSQMKIRGRVALSASDRLRVPDILPLRAQQIERFIVLPQHLDLQQVTWDTLGLSRAQLPVDFVARRTNPQSLAVYRVSGEHFQASLKAVKRAGSSSHVMLADIHLNWQPDGNCQAVAAFDLESGGANHCVLQLPPGHELLHASVESLPALAVRLDASRWRLGLGPQQLPQRVEVIYTGPLAGTSSQRRFQAPRLLDIEVERTLWTILGPPQFGFPGSGPSSWAVSASGQDLQRLKSVEAIVQLPAEIVGEHLPEEIVRWYRPWRKRYEASRGALVASSEEALEAHKLDAQIGAVGARLGVPAAGAGQMAPFDASDQLPATAPSNSLPAYFSVRGESNDLELNYHSGSNSWLLRLFGALTILLGGSATAFALRSRGVPALPPWLVMGGIGLVWWLFLTPSFLGFAILLAAFWTALRSRPWQGTVRLPAN